MDLMAAMPEDARQDVYYTVQRLRWLLHLYPYLGYSKPPQDDEKVKVLVKRVFGRAGWEEAAARAADIEQAVRWLNERDWRAAYCVRASYIVGLSEEDIAGYLARRGVVVHRSTINRWKLDGLANMSAWLNGKMPG